MKYTAEKVRDYADACRLAHNGPVIADMLTELAERIKVDESAAPVGFVMEATATRHKFCLLTQDLPPGAELFTHPPAQAVQVDPAAKPHTLADFVHASDAELVQPCEKCKGRGEVFNDVHVRMMTCPHCHGARKVASAEPVAQAARCDKPGCNCATWKPEGCAWDDAEPVAQPADSGRVPDGWVLVPREPTKAMLDAAMTREDDEPLTDWGKIIPAPHAEIYKAMLAAAPQPGESA